MINSIDDSLPPIPRIHHSLETLKEALGPETLPKESLWTYTQKRASTWAEIVELYRTSNNLENSDEFKAQFLHKDSK